MTSKLIINADDFGYNSNVNAAIVRCFQKGLINSASLMINMEGFEEALALAEQYHLKDKIGIHFNLTEGKPLTDLSDTGLTDKNQKFIAKEIFSPSNFFSLTVRNKIKKEIREQYARLTENNLKPTHMDSHQHVHTLPWTAPLFLDFAKENNLCVRILKNKGRNPFKIFYHNWFNHVCKKNRINFSDKFYNVGSFNDYLKKHNNLELEFEVMVHPALCVGVVIDGLNFSNLEEELTHLKKLYSSKTVVAFR